MNARKREPLVLRWYRRVLLFYPRRLRAEHGEEMAEVVRRRWHEVRDATAARRLVFHLRTWGDALAQCAAAWLEVGIRRLSGGRRRIRASRRIRVDRGSHLAALAGVAGDLRIAARSLRRTPGFTAAAVATLALGIGANTAIFSIVDAVLLDPLPYPESDRLVTVSEVERPATWTPTEIVLDLRRSSDSFEAFAGFYPRTFTVTGADRPEELEGAAVTEGFFQVLGVGLRLGREFGPGDAVPGAAPTAVIGPGLWERRYGGAADVLGRTIRVDGVRREIVGVLDGRIRRLTPQGGNAEVWVPFEIEPSAADGSFRWMVPVMRLERGVPLERARAELDAVMARFHDSLAGSSDWRPRQRELVPLKEVLIRDVRKALWVLQLAVGVLLVLACVNVANLLLVRAGSRQSELAVRAALGASRGRLVRYLLAESLVLALLGGAAALGLMVGGLDLVVALAPADVPRLDRVALDASVLTFTLAVSLATGLVFGVVPALATVRHGLRDALKGGGRTVTASRRRHGVSQGLVVAQVTLTMVLLVGAGLMVRSFLLLTAQDPGFRTADVVTASLHVSEDRYPSVPRLEDFYRRLRERVAAVPGVEAAAVSNYLPIRQGSATREFQVEGERTAPGDASRAATSGTARTAQYGVVSPDYFRALDIPLLRGRAFEASDRRGGRPFVVVNEALWRELWPDRDPLGERMRFSGEDPWMTVVGVVGDIRGDGLARNPRPGFFISYQQRPATETELAVGRDGVLLVRSSAGVEALAGPLREAVRDVDPRQPVPEIATLGSAVAAEVGPERFRAVLLGAFAGVALLLAIAGIHGVVGYLVSGRRREFGIRAALGATPGDILGTVLRWGLRLAALGVVLGVAGVVLVSRWLVSLLFGVAPTDPVTILASAAAVVLVTLAACLVPARRAMAVDPMSALRSG